MNDKHRALLAAAFGGSFPSLFNLATLFTGKEAGMPNPTFWLGVLVFAALGAAVAMIWKETDLPKAFYLGVGLPSLLQAGAGYVTESREKVAELPRAVVELFVKQAQAQGLHAVGRTIVLTPGANAPTSAVFYSADGKKQIVPLRAQGKQRIQVPPDASEVGFKVGETASDRLPLPPAPNATVQYKVDAQPNTWSGFQRAIGARNVSDYDVRVEQTAGPAPERSKAGPTGAPRSSAGTPAPAATR